MQQAVRHAYGYGKLGGITEKILIFYYGDLGNILYSTPNKEWAVFFINIFYNTPGHGVYLYIILFLQYYSVVCRPSDPTVENPVQDSNPGPAFYRDLLFNILTNT